MLWTTKKVHAAIGSRRGCTGALADAFGVSRDSGGGIVMADLYGAIADAYEGEVAQMLRTMRPAGVEPPVENPWREGLE